MYKKLVATLFVTTALATVMFADFARVEAGVGIWNQEPTDSISNISYDKESDSYVWAYVKHPTPVIPNLRVEYSTATATPTNNPNSSLEFTQIEVIPYYNILDNTAWITIDLGLDLRSISLDNAQLNKTDDVVLPLGYLRTRFQLPLSGLGAEADVKYVSYSDNKLYDARIKLDYTFDITPLIQPGVEIGYRVQKIETDELLNTTYNLEFSGVYVGAMIRF